MKHRNPSIEAWKKPKRGTYRPMPRAHYLVNFDRMPVRLRGITYALDRELKRYDSLMWEFARRDEDRKREEIRSLYRTLRKLEGRAGS